MTKLKTILKKLKNLQEKNKKNQEKTKNKYFSIIFYLLLIFFLILNIIYSQKIDQTFIGLIKFNKDSVINFLKKTKTEKYFNHQIDYFENIFGKEIRTKVFEEENQINYKIKKLEEILKKNPDSRDVLYNLSILYKKRGENKKSNEYLKKAEEVDPFIFDKRNNNKKN